MNSSARRAERPPAWEVTLAAIGGIGAIAALWITLGAGFLAYPGWLAVQKADFILGPLGVGLYWHHRRPGNTLGLLLILLGVFGLLYIGGSIDAPVPFGIGVFSELPLVLLTEAAILAYPSGRFGLVEKSILAFMTLTFFAGRTVIWLTSPHSAPWFSISACKDACPTNAGAIWSPPGWAPHLVDGVRATVIVTAVATAGLLVWKFVNGTPPRRRALAIGAPIALVYLGLQITYQGLQLFSPANASAAAQPIRGDIDWAFAGARSAVWYGFLFALIAAELFAARVLRDVVRSSLQRPSLRELEGMLRAPLGDPGLRLGFWRPSDGEWIGHDGLALEAPTPAQRMTMVDRDGRPSVAIVHDVQLADDPELVQAAGAAALLAHENAELETAWKQSVDELADSRARLASASERERRKLGRDLHDGAQQHLVAANINLTLAEETGDARELQGLIAESRTDIEQALVALRELAHGIYPTELARSGVARALNLLAGRDPDRVIVREATAERFSPEIELAVYYCGLEAVQNATKHAGSEARVWIRLFVEAGLLHLEVQDDGRGFDAADAQDGIGLQNMRDRLAAVGGQATVASAPGKGTLVTARVPVGMPPGESPAEWRPAPELPALTRSARS